MHLHIHMNIYTYIDTYIQMYKSMYAHRTHDDDRHAMISHIYIYIYIYIYIIYIHTYIHTYIKIYISTYECIYIHIHTRMAHDDHRHPHNPRHRYSTCVRAHARASLPCRRPLPTRRAQQAPALSPRARDSSPTATLSDRVPASTRRSLQYRGILD